MSFLTLHRLVVFIGIPIGVSSAPKELQLLNVEGLESQIEGFRPLG